MAEAGEIIGLTQWLQTPAGRYLLDWEQRHLEVALADVFGFHALQLGLPELDALRGNRMPHRWIATDASRSTSGQPVHLHCDYDALPFDSASLDLVVLPHTLEIARDPHLALREVDRVLMPEGRVVVVGFNPMSLWGLRQKLGRARSRVLRGGTRPLYLPAAGEFIGFRRLRDWLRLLSFEVEAGRFGCYLPPVASETWMRRFGWMDGAGERWWPPFGAVYFVVAVKRVRGMRLVGLLKNQRPVNARAPAVVVQSRQRRELVEEES
jgi:SAM-dependent methyltransferase